jgi:hypothetical protein
MPDTVSKSTRQQSPEAGVRWFSWYPEKEMIDHPAVDLVLFAVSVVAFLAIGLPLITRQVFIPAVVEFDRIADHELSPEQSFHFARLDVEMLELGYRPAGTRRPTNMQGDALVRLYFSAVDPAVISANLITAKVPVGNEQSADYLEIVTQFRDGTTLSTRNAEISDVLDRLPDHILVERRGLPDAARLKKEHDARAAELLAHDPIHRRPEEFETAFNEHHRRWCDHLLERGLVRRSPENPEILRPTVKTGLRGILNFINPLADNFTPVRFLTGAVFGLIAPACGILWIRGPGALVVARAAAALGLAGDTGSVIALAIVVGISGAVVGLVFVEKSFIWSFVFTYVLLRLIAPTGFLATVALCVWAGALADRAGRWRQRRRRLV